MFKDGTRVLLSQSLVTLSLFIVYLIYLKLTALDVQYLTMRNKTIFKLILISKKVRPCRQKNHYIDKKTSTNILHMNIEERGIPIDDEVIPIGKPANGT